MYLRSLMPPIKVNHDGGIRAIGFDTVTGKSLGFRLVRMAKPTDRHRVYMSFMRSHGWYCQFLEENLQMSLPRKFNFASEDKVRELVERGGGIVDSESRKMLKHAINMGRGGLCLSLTDEQYDALKRG